MAYEKRCGKCGTFKPEIDFYLLAGKYRASYCRSCDNIRRRAKPSHVRAKSIHVRFKKEVELRFGVSS